MCNKSPTTRSRPHGRATGGGDESYRSVPTNTAPSEKEIPKQNTKCWNVCKHLSVIVFVSAIIYYLSFEELLSFNGLNRSIAEQTDCLAESESQLFSKDDRVYTVNQQNHKDKKNRTKATSSSPHIVWLMTFPNSGTSYTMTNIKRVSQRSTATNYKRELTNQNLSAIPVYDHSPFGPFLLKGLDSVDRTMLPQKYLMTKTHCGGRCTFCDSVASVETPHSFLRACRSDQGTLHPYDPELVHKAVHLFRNPFDNVVARFHLALKSGRSAEYSKSKEGFLEFCEMIDTKFGKQSRLISRLTEPSILNTLKSVPCYLDFIRYVEWHNLAFVTTDELDLPTYRFHYEDYETNYNQTVNGLLNFLELDRKGGNLEFITGKSYQYFTLKQKKDASKALEQLSSKRTWENIQHYFPKP